ncbi:MAG: glutamine amidotransferase [Methyloceanibacter sp.]|uniref:glutamine amidotransferase n=1 Tax=Methyloceanibacter sp. TaxID=1965321 RepID=UPI001DDB8FDA|nr:glutamine amidotransferase [Methyloceanibacter sp.]MCB1443461.1 glutamine amidotransferase [Methyloceanibacter sp.]
MKNAVAIYHVAFEDAGILEPVLDERGVGLTYLQAGRDDLSPALDADLVLVLGGPISIYEFDRYPFLKGELQTIEAVVKKGIPVVGICLGAQALAAVLAARVYPGKEKELGWDQLILSEDGKASPLGVLEGRHILNWHGDTFDLPSGATRLASTPITPNQAFAYGSNVLALQFHVELPEQDMERWLIGHTLELANSNVDLNEMRAETARHAPATNVAGRALFKDWLDRLPSA